MLNYVVLYKLLDPNDDDDDDDDDDNNKWIHFMF